MEEEHEQKAVDVVATGVGYRCFSGHVATMLATRTVKGCGDKGHGALSCIAATAAAVTSAGRGGPFAVGDYGKYMLVKRSE